MFQKRIISLLTVLCLLFSFSMACYAAEPTERLVSSTVVQHSEDSYTVIEIYEEATFIRGSTKVGHKDYNHYVGGSLAWTFTVHGTFDYTGSSATCTAASFSYNIAASGWTLTNAGAYRTGASAKATGTMSHTDGRAVYPNVTLTCSGSGVLS